jgi:hypothetical protein
MKKSTAMDHFGSRRISSAHSTRAWSASQRFFLRFEELAVRTDRYSDATKRGRNSAIAEQARPNGNTMKHIKMSSFFAIF